jgi:hypothetical protein
VRPGGAADDCDDGDPAIHPNALDLCNGSDDNCNGLVDEEMDADFDGVVDCVDNCAFVPNPAQEDSDSDGHGDACDTCPTVPDPEQDPCACNFCGVLGIFISMTGGPEGAAVSWRTGLEHDLRGFNVVKIDKQGRRTQLNPTLIPCQECSTDRGASYRTLVSRQRGGQDLFIEMVHQNGQVERFGPAIRPHGSFSRDNRPRPPD